jgi:hypothetical protein
MADIGKGDHAAIEPAGEPVEIPENEYLQMAAAELAQRIFEYGTQHVDNPNRTEPHRIAYMLMDPRSGKEYPSLSMNKKMLAILLYRAMASAAKAAADGVASAH